MPTNASNHSIPAEKIAGDFQFLEGPVWVPTRNELLFSDIPAGRICRYTPATNSFSIFREPSGQANGNALDPQGRLVTCEHENRRTSRTELDGTVSALATHYEGKRLNSPNDIVCKSDGSVYFSDPPYGVNPELRELDFQGVFRVSADSETLTLVASDFIKPNGLAFSPDEKILYVADTEIGHIRAFDVSPDGTLTNSRVFCNVERPDGFRVDVEGSLYISAMKSVEVFDRTGKKFGEITLPERPANVAFGDPDRQTLYICARTGLYRARINVPGAK
ncbi:MAG TPA: SMP-30/gluconolactonase/LRE family protein [Verrucomicrobiae bacterium]|nr:SMP-30/gluconolactonase/LRE family protein [Verrucomicrobiae bacterium]